jgi:hypothetical protein
MSFPEVKVNIQSLATSPEGDFVLQEPEMDALDRARHVWKKGRLEFMGGPVYFTQGAGIPGYENNERKSGFGPMSVFDDPEARKLQVDTTEQ